ncbi:HGL104Wp [Eremothecium sinecaudum]|uniref:Ribosomal RNA-processing protein 8 n=1 Tax=Eremothecium sinecaudum TaxID=45286 RepID=A0A0X8HVF1_9SACH|nr:HGL104Wp [Eremothecium sinecaudum]AMD22236.1 HGL104Wp [Eremothecium sinecaudum]
MGLFQVEGWDLDSKQVLFHSANKKLNIKKNDRKARKNNKLKDAKSKEEIEESKKDIKEPKKDIEEVTTQKIKSDSATKKRPHDQESEPSSSNKKVTPNTKKPPLTPLQQKMLAKLSGSRFRWINEQLYTISSNDALKLMKEQPALFDEYHEGFRSQVQSWPENPVDVFVQQIKARAMKPVNAPGGLPGLKDKKIVLADMGCGEATLALHVNEMFKNHNKRTKYKKNWEVHSFDLKKANDRITVADIKNVPLPDNSCTIVVFCLALMGTNFLDFIKEAYRILAPRGELWIAEIKSRFSDNGDEFVNALKLNGFFHKTTDDQNKMFTRFEFFKPPKEILEERKAKLERRQKFIEVETEKEELEKKRTSTPEGKWLLKPCIYKRR